MMDSGKAEWMKPDLYPASLSLLMARLEADLNKEGPVYELDRRFWWTPKEGLDLGFEHPGGRIATPVGPAAGPHTQLAQNIVLSWLGGARFMELKTVQIDDELVIPRPCIDVPHIGYNVEWSQELRVPQSLEEYAKAWWLVHILASEQGPGLWPGRSADTVFDLSIGYDLEGISSPKVRRFIEQMLDASDLLGSLKEEVADRFPDWAAVPCPSQISNTVTISTFHGCPADEIESIASHLLTEYGLHTIVKLNPTLLGYDRVRELLDTMGYDYIKLRPGDFEKDLQWEQLFDMLPRLEALAAQVGRGFGIKLTNTLVCESEEPNFSETEMYLSGPPLHVVSTHLAHRIREALNKPYLMTFSAGVDARNFSDCVAAGLGPVTTCSDLLKGRGYGRLSKYLHTLESRMQKLGAQNLDQFIAASGPSSAENLNRLDQENQVEPRYRREKNMKPPKKIGSHLDFFDCITCDKCVPVCPNVANFTVKLPQGSFEPGRLRWSGDDRETLPGEPLIIEKKHQIGNIIDFCNECGQCDVWCPEDGGPYIVKPHLFLSRAAFEDHPNQGGFLMERGTLFWRRDGRTLTCFKDGARWRVETDQGRLFLDGNQVVESAGSGDLDLRDALTLTLFHEAFSDPEQQLWLDTKASP